MGSWTMAAGPIPQWCGVGGAVLVVRCCFDLPLQSGLVLVCELV